jgi:GAF domain-containing protein
MVVNPRNARLDDGLLAISSLMRALGGNAQLADIGSLVWVLIRQIVPCDAMAFFLPDDTHDHVVARFSAGAHAHALRGVTRPTGTGMAGWVAVHRVPIVNGEPILDLGFRAESSPTLRSTIAVPLVESDALIAVLTLYSKELLAFSDDHLRILELLAPKLAASMVDAVIADEDRLYPPCDFRSVPSSSSGAPDRARVAVNSPVHARPLSRREGVHLVDGARRGRPRLQ